MGRSLSRRLAVAAAGTAVMACGGGGGDAGTGPGPTVAAVVVTSPSSAPTFGTLGRTLQFTAEPRTSSGTAISDKTPSWSSSSTAVAAISASGLLTVVGNGTTQVRATVEGIQSAPVTVTVSQVASALTVSPSTATTFATLGRTLQLTAAATDSANNPVTPVSWTSTNSAAAPVSATGLVTAAANGSTQITASAGGATSAPVAVTVNQVTASMSITPGTFSFGAQGSARQLSAVARDSSAATIPGRSVTWSSTNTGVATVNSSGLATSIANGSAHVQATADGVTGSASVTVAIVAKLVSIVQDTIRFRTHGRAARLTVQAQDSNGNAFVGPITYVSRNALAFGVNDTGLVTSTFVGYGYVTASAGSAADSVFIDSFFYITGITLSPRAFTFGSLGKEQVVNATLTDSAGVAPPVVAAPGGAWSIASRNAAVAAASVGDRLTSAGNGSTYIVATTNGGAIDSVQVTVQQVPARVGMAACSQLNAIGFTCQATATVRDSNARLMEVQPSIAFHVSAGGSISVSPTGLITAQAVTVGEPDSVYATTAGPSGPISNALYVVVRQIPKTMSVISTAATPDTLSTTGRMRQFSVSGVDSNNVSLSANNLYTWSSNDPRVANVDYFTGLVTAVGDGSAIVTAYCDLISPWITATRPVQVRRYASTFALSPTSVSLTGAGSSRVLNGTAQDSSGVNLPIAWLTRSPTVASINPVTGPSTTVSAVASGVTSIVMSAGLRSDSAVVTTTVSPVGPSRR